MISYAINASLDSNVDETWVSTEDKEISKVASSFGANIMERPKELALDHSTSEEVLMDFARKMGDFDIMIFVQATCPMILSSDINLTIEMMELYDSVITVSILDQFLWKKSGPLYNINDRKRRQDREQMYIETGSIFATTKDRLLKYNNRISGVIGFVKVPKLRSIDIDTYEDLELVKKIMSSNSS